MRSFLLAPLLAPLLALAGCAAQRGSLRFTSPDELKKLTQQPKPTKVFADDRVTVDHWDLAGPLATTTGDAAHENASLFAPVLFELAQTKGFTPSAPFACVAREFGRFVALKGGAPSTRLRAFITARCGVTSPVVSVRWLSGKAAPDDALTAAWTQDVRRLVGAIAPRSAAGLATVREGDAVFVVVASATATVTLEPVTLTPDADGFVWLRGVTPRATDAIVAHVNQGPTGSVECISTERLDRPAFELKCKTLATDETAWLSLMRHEPGRVLGTEVARVLTLPSGALASTWRPAPLVVANAAATPDSFVDALNHVRGQIGLTPLVQSPAQSAENHELTPFLFEAFLDAQADTSDRIALGVLAGWRVEREIMAGTFATGVASTRSTAELLATMLEAPTSRRDLLSPRAGIIAVGLVAGESALGALVSVYEPLQPPAWPDTANRVLNALNAQRQRNGKKPVQWVLLPGGVERTYAEAVTQRKYDSAEALERFMGAASEATHRGLRGWRIPALDLFDVTWPPELLSADSVELLFTVTNERAPNDPWGQYVFLAIMLERPQPET